MFTDIVREIEADRVSKTLLNSMAYTFENNLPDSLYLNQYELAEEYGFTPTDWKKFISNRDVDRLIQKETAQIAEIGARHALKKLQSGHAASADIQAAKELLANSKLIKQKTNQRPQYVITRIPPKEKEAES